MYSIYVFHLFLSCLNTCIVATYLILCSYNIAWSLVTTLVQDIKQRSSQIYQFDVHFLNISFYLYLPNSFRCRSSSSSSISRSSMASLGALVEKATYVSRIFQVVKYCNVAGITWLVCDWERTFEREVNTRFSFSKWWMMK